MEKRSLADRFWKKVDKNGPIHPLLETACWLWTGSRLPRGYGTIGGGGAVRGYAHRISWESHFGTIPKDLWVLHRCDNPPCCNPAHPFLGTHRDNMADMSAKGRGNYANSAKTRCKHGHEFTQENTRTADDGHRTCITCERAKSGAHYEQNRAVALARSVERYRATMATDPEAHRRRSRESMQRHRDKLKRTASHSSPSAA